MITHVRDQYEVSRVRILESLPMKGGVNCFTSMWIQIHAVRRLDAQVYLIDQFNSMKIR